jgi:hypothetical protein
MHSKQALLENMANLSPEAKGALVGSLVGAGGAGLAGIIGSRKNKLRNGLLSALAGGLGGGAAGYFGGGGTLGGLGNSIRNHFANVKATPGGLGGANIESSFTPGAEAKPGLSASSRFTDQPFGNK